jgi:pimeloyl-ACP methyl ester carboxylesterase
MSPLAFTRSGTDAPLVLLHGLGASRRSFDPVLPALAARFDVIAVDLPGFGDSAPLPGPGAVPPAALAQHVADLLDDLGVSTPHVVGNSLGGWVALELASRRPVASLTLLSPAGLWPRNTPLYDRISLRASRWLARHATGLLCRLVGSRLGRTLVLGQTHGHPMRLSAEYARAAVTELGRCPGFEAALAGTAKRHFVATAPFGPGPAGTASIRTAPIGTVPIGIGTMPITAPVTVAFGSRDLLLRPGSRRLGQLPPQTRTAELPGCGHLPMADDPAAVAALITQAAAQADRTAAPADQDAVA